MLDRAKVIETLIEVHKVIAHDIQSIESSIDALMPLAVKPLSAPEEVKLIRENIRNIGVALYYLKEGKANHEKMDKAALEDVVSITEITVIDKEHDSIAKALDSALMQVELADSEKWNVEELKNYLRNLKSFVHAYHELVVNHNQRENELFRRVLEALQ